MSGRGAAFLLKTTMGDDYATVGGFKAEKIDINGEAIAVTKPIPKGAWREVVSGGARSVDVGASGIFTGSAAEKEIRSNALSGSVDQYELSFESGERLRGRFMVTSLEYAGDFNGERNYRIALASSGEVTVL